MTKELSFLTKDADETALLGEKLAKIIKPSDLIFLQGDLGSGKTTFMRGFLRGLNFTGKVKSPSYTLLEQYELELTINHFDLYRFKDQREWDDAGFNEFINSNDINVIEWPEKAVDVIPISDLTIFFAYLDDKKRNIVITGNSSRGRQCIDLLS
jgi:tRNA threonylcarbamoyladenosine biosynthesis protein TsaE